MKIATALQSYERKPFLKVAVTGHSGAGKTHWAARSPRPLILLTESQALPSIVTANPEAVVVQIERWDDFREAFNAVKLGTPVDLDTGTGVQPALQVTLQGQSFIIQTLVVDTMTDLQRLAYDKMKASDLPDGPDRLDLTKASGNLSLDKQGNLMSTIEEVWRQQRSIPVNTVFLFMARDVQDDTQAKQTIPMLSGQKLPYAMGQYFNASGLAQVRRTDAGTMQHLIRWSSPSAAALTKPGPGWPSVTVNTATAGETTLGSLLRYTFPEMRVAYEVHDEAGFVPVRQSPPTLGLFQKAVALSESASLTDTTSAPNAPQPTDQVAAPTARRRRA